MYRVKTFLGRHRKRLFIIIPILIVLAVIFWPRPQAVIETQTVNKTDLVESLSSTGQINAEVAEDLTFQVSGQLATINVKKGDFVQKGQVIATLDQRTVMKNLENVLRSYSLQRNTFDQTLDNNNANSPTDAVNDTIKRTLQSNQYSLDQAVIAVQLQNLAIEQSVLTTPIAGTVTRTDVSAPGVNVTPTTTFAVADLSSLVFEVDIDEADVGKISIGQPVTVTLNAFPNDKLSLKVSTIDYATHTTSSGGNAFTVSVNMPQKTNDTYRIGMNGDAEIITNEKHNVLAVPLSSLTEDNFVYIKIDKGFEKKKVGVGLTNDTEAEIISGINQGDQVALDPLEAEKAAQTKKFLFF